MLPVNAIFFTQNSFSQTIQIIIAIALIFHELDEYKNGKQLSKKLIEFLKNMDNTNYVLDINTTMASEYTEIKNVIDKREKVLKIKEDEESSLIQEAKTIMDLVKQGSFEHTINTQTSNTALEEFKSAVNDMIVTIKNNFSVINTILLEYKNYDYRNKVELGKITSNSELDVLVKSINNLKDAIRTMLVENKDKGIILENSSNILLENVDKLNNSSLEAVESLQNTSSVLSQVTQNVENTSNKTIQMLSLSKEVTNSVNDGEKLALKTNQSMDEINEKVSSINEAITVIDQIAFQTNILSLNAAVEAATAGEAGKGFAVVAQEVRNLANKSADAAKDIKNLVELANNKANEGKSISTNMIEGYTSLNNNINKTMTLINEVADTSVEQKKAIVDINNSVDILNSQINTNKKVTTQTHDIAMNTANIANTIVEDSNNKQL
jgi:methyl-accepting chemotaxis protein